MAFNAKRYNASAFSEGAWVEIMGGRFKLAYFGNPEFEAIRRELGLGKMEDPAKEQDAAREAFARGIMRDWAEVEDDKGEAIPFSVENAEQVLADNPDLADRIAVESRRLANFRREDIEDQGKPRAGSSGGKQSGKQAS